MSADEPVLDVNERAQSKRVQNCLEAMHDTRKLFNEQRQAGRLGAEMRLELQCRVVDVYQALRPYRDRVDDDDWRDVTAFGGGDDEKAMPLPDAVAAKPVTREKSVGLGRTRTTVEREPVLIEPGDLLEISQELDDLAEEMGFEPGPEQAVDDVHGGQI